VYSLAGLIPLLPLLAAGLIAIGSVTGLSHGENGEKTTARIALGGAGLALLLTLCIDGLALVRGAPGQIAYGEWLRSGEYSIGLSLTLDALGLSMTTLVALLSLLTLRFSVNYLHREAGYPRFFMVLCLFTAAMLTIVMAGNALLLFAGWELAGLSSYLLIGYAFDRTTATRNATRAFVTNRIGDAGFLVAIALSLFWLGSVEWPAILACGGTLEKLLIAPIVGGFLLAALAKSAQLPFSAWITRALEGPTPSSAVFYGALMVHAGVYLVIRLQPLFEQVPLMMALLSVIGAATALYGYLTGLVQTDVKSTLIFSTLAQVGLMFLACGLGWFTFAAWYLAAHAAWRAYQFLSAPALMHYMSRPARPVPAWLAGRRALYAACLHRFWLDNLSDWLLVRPTRALARDAQSFDQRIVNRLVGLPGSAGAVSSLAQWEAIRQGRAGTVVDDSGGIGRARGVAGSLLQALASALHWFEEHLVLQGGDQGLFNLVQRIGNALAQIESLLSKPRYLILIIVITFIVIL
jgi:NADH:ubiquinone oxidoreductase subunit 5 (subunit L)/multisubunit Na+/H+ antiporter MnhA subunit